MTSEQQYKYRYALRVWCSCCASLFGHVNPNPSRCCSRHLFWTLWTDQIDQIDQIDKIDHDLYE